MDKKIPIEFTMKGPAGNELIALGYFALSSALIDAITSIKDNIKLFTNETYTVKTLKIKRG